MAQEILRHFALGRESRWLHEPPGSEGIFEVEKQMPAIRDEHFDGSVIRAGYVREIREGSEFNAPALVG